MGKQVLANVDQGLLDLVLQHLELVLELLYLFIYLCHSSLLPFATASHPRYLKSMIGSTWAGMLRSMMSALDSCGLTSNVNVRYSSNVVVKPVRFTVI